jgi:hypothetical protein
MADIALKSSTAAVVNNVTNSDVRLDIVGIPVEQMTLEAGETILAGAAVRIDSNGKFVQCDGTTAGNAKAYGIAVKRATVGNGLTAIKRGILFGFDFSSQAFWSDIFVSDNVGELADAAGTSPKIVGQVVPHPAHVRGGTALKCLLVNL